MTVKQLNEMPMIIDFNYKIANDEIKRILDKENISDFILEDDDLNLYQCIGHNTSNSGEYWYVIFNDNKTDIDFIAKFRQMSILVNGAKYKVMENYHTYKKK